MVDWDEERVVRLAEPKPKIVIHHAKYVSEEDAD